MPPASQKAARGPYIDKPFRDALRVAVKREANSKLAGKTKLDRIAAQLVTTAMDGDVAASKEIADRLDGKVPQAVVGGGENDPAIQHVHRIELVDLT